MATINLQGVNDGVMRFGDEGTRDGPMSRELSEFDLAEFAIPVAKVCIEKSDALRLRIEADREGALQ